MPSPKSCHIVERINEETCHMSLSSSNLGANPDVLEQWSPTFLASGTGFIEDNFSTQRRGGAGGGGSEQWGVAVNADKALLAAKHSSTRLSVSTQALTSCCAAQLLTGHRPEPASGLGVRDPWPRGTTSWEVKGHSKMNHSAKPLSIQCFYSGTKVCPAIQYAMYYDNSRRRQWHPTPVLLPGKSHGWRSLVGCSPWGRKESDMTERLPFHFSLSCIGEGNGNPLQCSCLENPRDGGAWWAAFYGVSQSRTRLKRLSSSSSMITVLTWDSGCDDWVVKALTARQGFSSCQL